MRGNTPRNLAAGAVVLALFAAGCNTDSGSDTGSGKSDAVVSVEIAEPKHLIPTNTAETGGSQVLAALFSPLVDFDASSKPVLVAAESVESTDNKVWTIKLKSGYTFHNGEPVTSDNYINAWNYGAVSTNVQDNSYFFDKVEGYADTQSADPKTPPKAKTLSGLKKVDDSTFTVTLSAPFSEFKAVLGYTAFYPLPKSAWASEGVLNKDFENAMVGQGPFKIKGTWEHDKKIEVERYDAFSGTKPKVKGVVFKIYQTLETAYQELEGNTLDVIKTIPTGSLSTAPDELGDRYKQSPASTFQFVAFPTYQTEFKSPAVRKAISMAIDRDEIIDLVFKKSQSAARSFVSPVVAGYRKDTCGEACVFDAAKAKAAYTTAGGPAKLQISYNGDGGHKDWVDATCNQLKKNLGVECVGTAEPKFADLLTKVKARKAVGMFRMGWVMDYPSMENYLGPLYSTGGSSNYYGFSNKEFDQLVKDGAAAATADESIKKYQAAEDILAREMPVIPLRFGQNTFGHSNKVKNVQIDLFNRVDLLEIEAV